MFGTVGVESPYGGAMYKGNGTTNNGNDAAGRSDDNPVPAIRLDTLKGLEKGRSSLLMLWVKLKDSNTPVGQMVLRICNLHQLNVQGSQSNAMGRLR